MRNASRIDFATKYIKDSMKQLRNGNTIFVLNAKRCKEIEEAILNEGLNVTRNSHIDHWSFALNKEETK